MADEGRPPVWGLWNDYLDDWFNPGTRQPFWRTKDEAARVVPKAQRQYPMGRWEIREYPLEDPDQALEPDRAQPPAEPAARGPA